MESYINLTIFFLGCFISSFVNTANARAKNSNSTLWCFTWGLAADAMWFLVFKELIASNTLNISNGIMPILYIAGYSSARPLSQYVLMRFSKGDNSVGGVKTLESRISAIEEKLNEKET